MMISTDIKSLNDYCMTRDIAVVVDKGQIVGFIKDRYPLGKTWR